MKLLLWNVLSLCTIATRKHFEKRLFEKNWKKEKKEEKTLTRRRLINKN